MYLQVHKCALREEEISVICRDTLLALEYLHGMNYIHRDVKAGNILIADAGVVKLGKEGPAFSVDISFIAFRWQHFFAITSQCSSHGG